MQKTAQKRSVLNKLREKTNVGGIAAEKFFNPEFERVMNSLRAADNKARSIASGTEIEGEDAGEDATSLKDLLKNAKSYLNRREYMSAIAFLSRFHKKINEIIKVFKVLNLDVDKVHHDFLFKDLDDQQKKHLQDLKSRFASNNTESLIVEASIMDFLINVGTERGRALAAWEKRYPKQIGKLKKDLASLYDKSDLFLRSLLSSFKEMASYRATRKIDDYMKAASKIEGQYSNYDKMFKDFYNTNVKGFLEKQELLAPTKVVEDKKDLGNQQIPTEKQPVGAVPDLEVPSPKSSPEGKPVSEYYSQMPSFIKNVSDLPSQPPSGKPGELPPSGSPALAPPKVPSGLLQPTPNSTVPEEELKTEPTNEILPPPSSPRTAHSRFIASLEVLAEEKPQLLIHHIVRYANSISKTDPEVSKKLLTMARSIRG